MKFGHKKNLYKEGDKRKKTFFAWLPVCIKGEVRWLEEVTVLQEFTVDDLYGNDFRNMNFKTNPKRSSISQV